ncbi:MAG: GGDEF domain-containing protein [Candidatus Cloacimonadales bacterium]|nr:GGDEF domain-containing protein [Candidatus Cloacimonadales bacterium]
MNIAARRILKPFILPFIILVATFIIYCKWANICAGGSNELKAFFVILPLLPYLFFSIGILFGWRSNNAGLILNSLLMIIVYFGLSHLSKDFPTLPLLIGFLLPINILIWSNARNKHIFNKLGVRCLIIVLIEIMFVFFLSRFQDQPESKFIFEMYAEFPVFSLQLSNFMVFVLEFLSFKLLVGNIIIYLFTILCSCVLFYLYRLFHDAMYAIYFSVLIAVFPAIIGFQNPALLHMFFNAAGLILVVTSVEASFNLAYIDELTALSGRRSMAKTMANLGKTYTIAMIDIDHFKQFNDNYGHKTGDQVLQMVATKLSEISGGAKTFRYGGEEFTAVFAGKPVQQILEFLEEYRKTVENTPFIVRGKKRKSDSENSRGKSKANPDQQVTVTVSIGAASAGKTLDKPEKVLKAADKILYKAKHLGRNRVEIK